MHNACYKYTFISDRVSVVSTDNLTNTPFRYLSYLILLNQFFVYKDS